LPVRCRRARMSEERAMADKREAVRSGGAPTLPGPGRGPRRASPRWESGGLQPAGPPATRTTSSPVYRLRAGPRPGRGRIQEAFFSAYRQPLHVSRRQRPQLVGRIAVNGRDGHAASAKTRPVQPIRSWRTKLAAPRRTPPQSRSHHLARRALPASWGPPWRATAEQRACIVLFDVQGYDYGEIARLMASPWGP